MHKISFQKISGSIILILTFTTTSFLSCKDNKQKDIGSFERIDPALGSIIDSDATVSIIAEGLDWSEGPVWIEKDKMLLFSDVPQNVIYKWTAEKGKEVYLKPSGYTGTISRGGETGSNGLTLDTKGQLIICQHGDRRIGRMNAPVDKPKAEFTSIADNYNGKKFDSPNDVIAASNGNIYFTDPPYGLEKNAKDPLKESPYQGVYKVTPDGKVSLLVDTIARPNGLALMPGEKTLLIASSDSLKAVWYAYELNDKDSLTNGKIFYDATADLKTEKGLPDGLKIDKNGNVFATGPGGIYIFDKTGKLLGKIKIDGLASNIAFADDQKTLYVTADMYVLKVRLRK